MFVSFSYMLAFLFGFKVNPPLADKDGELLLSECEKSFSAYREFMEHLLVVFRQLPTLENLPRPDEAGVTFFTTLVSFTMCFYSSFHQKVIEEVVIMSST